MKLEKLGRIFQSSGRFPWMVSHAQVPIAESVEGNLYRIYFTCRDGQNHSHIAWLEIDITAPQRVLRLGEKPLLAPGAPGTFDDSGAMTSWLVHTPNRRFFYYVGWTTRTTLPFQNAIGLAVASAGAGLPALERHSTTPLLDRNPVDPHFCSNPCVIVEGSVWRMWYLSGREWVSNQGKQDARYDIRYAESDDGIYWRRDGHVCIGLRANEMAIARPSVVRDKDGYRMWYCYRGRDFPYRIGYAESKDGKAWERRDQDAGIAASTNGWDSEMIAYPYVFNHRGQRFMLYCGNGFSKEGFGLAAFA
jgi:hypothetical protein